MNDVIERAYTQSDVGGAAAATMVLLLVTLVIGCRSDVPALSIFALVGERFAR